MKSDHCVDLLVSMFTCSHDKFFNINRFLRPKETETPPQEQRSELLQNVSDQSSLVGCANPVYKEIIARMDVELTGTKDLNADMIFRYFAYPVSWTIICLNYCSCAHKTITSRHS